MNRKERRRLAKQSDKFSGQDKTAKLLAEGMALATSGRTEEAVRVYLRALRYDEANTNTHYVLGVLYRRLDQYDNSVFHYRRAVEIEPGFASAHYNLGNVLAETGQTSAAIAAFRDAVGADPNMATAWNNLGNALRASGDTSEAAKAYETVLGCAPDNGDALFNLGELSRDMGHIDRAIALFEKVLAGSPDHLPTLNNLGSILRDVNRLEEAAILLRHAISLSPDFNLARVNLANTLFDLGEFVEAEQTYEQALSLQPDNATALTNFGNLLLDLGRFDAAGEKFKAAVVLDPGFAEGHYNLGLFDLLHGDYATGWEHYGQRWQMPAFSQSHPQFSKPRWSGEPLQGKTLLVWDEQGVGDTVLFMSMLKDLLTNQCDVLYYCDPRLIPIINRSFPNVACFPKPSGHALGIDRNDYDFHSSIGDMAKYLRPDASSFTSEDAYLLADPKQVADLRARYKNTSDRKLVGVAWHSKGPDTGPKKSILLNELRPILKHPDAIFVDLQYGDTSGERHALSMGAGINLLHDTGVDQMHDLDAFAAQLAAMDYVVTISNTTAHIAGSLGVPTLLMACHVPIWYWMREGAHTPWYPSVEIFRQAQPGSDWTNVIEAVTRQLSARITADA